MRAIICGGGTAGHVTPAIAIGEEIMKCEPESDILFIGREGGGENLAITQRGFRLECLKIEGLSRKISINGIKKLFTAAKALIKAGSMIKEFSPDVVVGTGGYVCWPVLRAAQLRGIPTVIHESNATPGLTTRMLASRCKRVLLNFPFGKGDYKRLDNLCVVGNPLPDALTSTTRAHARRRLGLSDGELFILSFGGSGGSKAINDSVISLMKSYSSRTPRIRHTHATGRKYYEETDEAYKGKRDRRGRCTILPYIDDMHLYMRAADILICRCGSMTLSEAACVGAAPILIPSPNVTDNHQYKNARRLVDCGAAIMIEESELNERTLLDAVRYLECNPQARKKMQEKILSFYKADSREKIVNEIRKVIE